MKSPSTDCLEDAALGVNDATVLADRIDAALLPLESAADALEHAVRAQDWVRAGSLNRGLRETLRSLGALIDEIGDHLATDTVNDLTDRLHVALERHEALTGELVAARDTLGQQLGRTRSAHRGAVRYLDTAGG